MDSLIVNGIGGYREDFDSSVGSVHEHHMIPLETNNARLSKVFITFLLIDHSSTRYKVPSSENLHKTYTCWI